MQIVVFGATGRIGANVVDEALSRGWNVRAAVRGNARPMMRTRMTTVGVDLDDPERLGAAVGDADAVIAVLGPRRNSSDQVAVFAAAARRIVSAMERQRVFRLVMVSGAGVRLPNERPSRVDGLLAPIEGRPDRWVVAAKQAEFDVISGSLLEWTALRPRRVGDGPRTGRYRISDASPSRLAFITPADVAVAVADQVAETRQIRQAPYVWTPRGRS
jgi:putative NADH-flavin reductase